MIGPWLISPILAAVQPWAMAVLHLQVAGTRWALGLVATHGARLVPRPAVPFAIGALACVPLMVVVRAQFRSRRTR